MNYNCTFITNYMMKNPYVSHELLETLSLNDTFQYVGKITNVFHFLINSYPELMLPVSNDACENSSRHVELT